MQCESCEVEMRRVDDTYGTDFLNRREFECPECGDRRERHKYQPR